MVSIAPINITSLAADKMIILYTAIPQNILDVGLDAAVRALWGRL